MRRQWIAEIKDEHTAALHILAHQNNVCCFLGNQDDPVLGELFDSLLVAIFGWVAEQERSRLIERTKAGIERARRRGKRLGRPPCSPILLRAAADRVGKGESMRSAAASAQIPERSLRRFLAGAAKRPSPSMMDEAVVSRLCD
jgi:DNA invertase Pin-like site-specific DNA recombinase